MMMQHLQSAFDGSLATDDAAGCDRLFDNPFSVPIVLFDEGASCGFNSSVAVDGDVGDLSIGLGCGAGVLDGALGEALCLSVTVGGVGGRDGVVVLVDAPRFAETVTVDVRPNGRDPSRVGGAVDTDGSESSS